MSSTYGKEGEELAVSYLQSIGYQIIERNWRFGKEEVDIIAIHSDQLVFIEVKTRTNDYLGNPEEAVTLAKQKSIIRVAAQYVEQSFEEREVRFDIIAIIRNSDKEEITHFKEAFSPQW